MLKITLTKGLVGKTESQRRVVAALGLSKYGSCVVRASSPTITGMINKVAHLVKVEEVSDTGNGAKKMMRSRGTK
jgi:large subunit ribosomal protein L30